METYTLSGISDFGKLLEKIERDSGTEILDKDISRKSKFFIYKHKESGNTFVVKYGGREKTPFETFDLNSYLRQVTGRE